LEAKVSSGKFLSSPS